MTEQPPFPSRRLPLFSETHVHRNRNVPRYPRFMTFHQPYNHLQAQFMREHEPPLPGFRQASSSTSQNVPLQPRIAALPVERDVQDFPVVLSNFLAANGQLNQSAAFDLLGQQRPPYPSISAAGATVRGPPVRNFTTTRNFDAGVSRNAAGGAFPFPQQQQHFQHQQRLLLQRQSFLNESHRQHMQHHRSSFLPQQTQFSNFIPSHQCTNPTPEMQVEKNPNAKKLLNEFCQKHRFQSPNYVSESIGNSTFPNYKTSLELPTSWGLLTPRIVFVCATSKKESQHICATNAVAEMEKFGILLDPQSCLSQLSSDNQIELQQGTARTIGNRNRSFTQLKDFLLAKLVEFPGKRHTVYLQMCPAAERRKRVQAALFSLERDGKISKTSPNHGRNSFPFWFPVGYDTTLGLGGNITVEQLGDGREQRCNIEGNIKYRLFDNLSESEGQTVQQLLKKVFEDGKRGRERCLEKMLFAMEQECNACRTVVQTAEGVSVLWFRCVNATAPPDDAEGDAEEEEEEEEDDEEEDDDDEEKQ